MISIDPSNQNSATKSAANELDDLFGSIKIHSESQINQSSSNSSGNVDQLDDCLPLFPSTNTNKSTNQSSFMILDHKYVSFLLIASSITSTKKGGLFDDLQDLLVDQSTGQKLPLTKRY